MSTANEYASRIVTGCVTQVMEGTSPRVMIAGEAKDLIVDIRSHQVAGCQALLGTTCHARMTEDEDGFAVLIDMWQEGKPPPWQRDPDGDAVMMEWWQLFRRMA